MTEFEVFRGPGDRLVAISVNPVGEDWVVRSGVQGKRMKVSTYPTVDHPSRDGVLSAVLNERYIWEYTGRLSPHGEKLSVSNSAVLFWSARCLDVDAFTNELLLLRHKSLEAGLDIAFCSDASGTFFFTDRSRFGTTTARMQPGCVSTVNGKGSGELSLQHDSLLAAFLVYVSRQPLTGDFDLAFEADGDLSTDAFFDRIVPMLKPEEASLLESLGMRSLAMSIRKRGKARISF